MKMTIPQTHYPTLEIDNREKDIVQICMKGKEDSNLIQIEREKLNALIDILKRINKT